VPPLWTEYLNADLLTFLLQHHLREPILSNAHVWDLDRLPGRLDDDGVDPGQASADSDARGIYYVERYRQGLLDRLRECLGVQAGHAGADDNHLLWAGRRGLKTFASQGQIIQAAGIHTARFITLPAKPSGQYYRPVQNESSTRRF